MTNKAKVFILLIVILLIAAVYLFINSKSVSRTHEIIEENAIKSLGVDLGLLEKSYKIQTKAILLNYARFSEDESLNPEQVKLAKDQLLALKVPAKFKDLHLSLVLALSKMEEYLAAKDESNKIESRKMIEEAKLENDWLN